MKYNDEEGQSSDIYIKLWKSFNSFLNLTFVTALWIACGILFQILIPLDIGLLRNFCISLRGVLNLIFLLLRKLLIGLKLSNTAKYPSLEMIITKILAKKEKLV